MVIGFAALIAAALLPGPSRDYEGLRLGMSKAEVLRARPARSCFPDPNVADVEICYLVPTKTERRVVVSLLQDAVYNMVVEFNLPFAAQVQLAEELVSSWGSIRSVQPLTSTWVRRVFRTKGVVLFSGERIHILLIDKEDDGKRIRSARRAAKAKTKTNQVPPTRLSQ
jgi:hypothetical protein